MRVCSFCFEWLRIKNTSDEYGDESDVEEQNNDLETESESDSILLSEKDSLQDEEKENQKKVDKDETTINHDNEHVSTKIKGQHLRTSTKDKETRKHQSNKEKNENKDAKHSPERNQNREHHNLETSSEDTKSKEDKKKKRISLFKKKTGTVIARVEPAPAAAAVPQQRTSPVKTESTPKLTRSYTTILKPERPRKATLGATNKTQSVLNLNSSMQNLSGIEEGIHTYQPNLATSVVRSGTCSALLWLLSFSLNAFL